MSANEIRVLLNFAGAKDADEAAASLHRFRQAAQSVQGLANQGQGILPGMIGPVQGLGQGRSMYEEHNRLLTDQMKQIRDLTQSYKEYEQAVFNVGRSYGYSRDQMVQMADAVKVLQGQGFREGTVTAGASYGRLTGLDPTALTQQMAGFAQQGAISNNGQTQQFMAAIQEAVMRGSRGGMTVLTADLLPQLSAMNQQALSLNPYGNTATGTQASLDFLANAYQSGIPGLRNGGAAQLYNQANQTLTGAESGMGGMLAWNAYQQAHPGSDYFDFEYGRTAGMQDPAYAKALIGQVRDVYGSNDKQRFVQGGQALGMTPQQYEALEKVMSYTGGDQDYSAILKRIGARDDIDQGAVGLIGQLEGAGDQAGIDSTIKSYELLSGKKYTGKRDKASVEQFFGQLGTRDLMGSNADSTEAAKNATSANYEDAAANLAGFTRGVYQANEAIGGLTRVLMNVPGVSSQVGAAGVASSIGGPLIGGALGIAGTALNLATTARLLNIPLSSILRPGSSPLSPATPTAFPPGSLAANAPVPRPPGAPAPTVGAGGGGALGRVLAAIGVPLMAVGIGEGLADVGGAISGGGAGRSSWAQAAASLGGGEGVGLGMGLGRRVFEQGPVGNTGLGAFARGVDDWETQHIPGWEALFGRRKAAGTPADPAKQGSTTQSPVDDLLAENKRQVELLAKIEEHLAVGANTDTRAQAAYGARNGGPITANGAGVVMPYNGIASYGNASSTGNAIYPANSGGVAGAGFGDPSLDQIEAMLKGTRLEGHGQDFIDAAKAARVPVSVALAMVKEESSFNTPAQGTKNNFGGLKGPGGTGAFADFPDIKSGINAVVGNMGTSIYQGLSLKDFVDKYLGGAAGGDPEKYLRDVLAMVGALGGNASGSSVPVQPGGGGGQSSSPATAAMLAGRNAANGAAAALGGGGNGGPTMLVGRLDLSVKMPDGSTERHWVDMAASSGNPYGDIINWPTRSGSPV